MSEEEEKKRTKNLDRMAISIIFLFMISNISPSLTIFKMVKFGECSQMTIVASIITTITTITTHSISFFFYLAFDKVYRKQFKNIIFHKKRNEMSIEMI